MPWGDFNNNDKNNKNKNPWGGQNKPSSSKNVHDIDEFLQKSQKTFNGIFGNGAPPPSPIKSINLTLVLVFGALTLWLATGFFIIAPEEQAVVLRFGKYDRIADPGLHYHIPSPFEKVIKQKVTRIERIEIGSRTPNEVVTNSRSRFSRAQYARKALMLTGDENIVDVNFEVQWRIANLHDFIFNIRTQQQTIKNSSESAVRAVIGKKPIASVLTDQRFDIEQESKETLQALLDEYNVGVEIVRLQLLRVDPPLQVVDAFRDVQAAEADKEREVNNAKAYRNEILPKARGTAEKIKADAEAYKESVIARAEGEASRFVSLYKEYKKAKDVTRKRIYLETMEEVLSGMDKIILGSSAAGGAGVLPYLPLSELMPNKKK